MGAAGAGEDDGCSAGGTLVAAVLPDVSGLDRVFDYRVPGRMATATNLGTVVRARLRGRRIRGWVVGLRREPPEASPAPAITSGASEQPAPSGASEHTAPPEASPGGATSSAGAAPGDPARLEDLKELEAVLSLGPPPEVVSLARWASRRYAGRLRPFLLAASPPRLVRALPERPARPDAASPDATRPDARAAAAQAPPPALLAGLVRRGIEAGAALVRLPPSTPRLDVVRAVLGEIGSHGSAGEPAGAGVLVLVPERRDVEVLSRLLTRRGLPVASLPEDWAAAAAGGRLVVAARAGAFAPTADLRAVVVLDAHDESYRETRAPTWSAPVVLLERARRAGVPALLVSSCPCLDLHGLAALVSAERSVERAGWPPLEVIDRRSEDPRSGRYSPRLAELIRGARRAAPELAVVCVLNRTGRIRLLACDACGEVGRCEACGAALHEPTSAATGGSGPTVLRCPSCSSTRPRVCATCGSARLKRLRVGTAGAAEELASLTGLEVREVTAREEISLAGSGPGSGSAPGLLVGTEAVLRRVRSASLVVFLDLDDELLAPRLRAGEQAFALLARAARLVGGRGPGSGRGPVVVQTRLPDHEVVRAALHGDAAILERAELERRSRLALPPFAALALLSGADAGELAERLRSAGLQAGPVATGGSAGAARLVRASDPATLAGALEAAGSDALDVRVEVDPIGV